MLIRGCSNYVIRRLLDKLVCLYVRIISYIFKSISVNLKYYYRKTKEVDKINNNLTNVELNKHKN